MSTTNRSPRGGITRLIGPILGPCWSHTQAYPLCLYLVKHPYSSSTPSDIRARSLRLYYLLPSFLAEGNRGKSNSNGTGLPNWTSVLRRNWTSCCCCFCCYASTCQHMPFTRSRTFLALNNFFGAKKKLSLKNVFGANNCFGAKQNFGDHR